MSDAQYRIEKDSMGEVKVPASALYAAQTQRALENFPISGIPFPRPFIAALAMVKATAAEVNQSLGLLDGAITDAITGAAAEVAAGQHDAQFPLDIFQTGSGTSTNMNANEVIATLATQRLGAKVHPNDHVNCSQSSNDVIPTTIHVSALVETNGHLIPAMEYLAGVIETKAASVDHVVTTGRTHLMDAMPIRLSQELSGWAGQIRDCIARLKATYPRIGALALGGTAIGTGINAHPEFGAKVAEALAAKTGLPFQTSGNYFVSLSSLDAVVELSGQLKTYAAALMKIANDLRWMNSGPIHGIAEIALPSLQPGSSIMPAKVNPVVPESAAMVCAQVIGNDATITVAGQSGNFQLNVMLPVAAYNLLQSIHILGSASRMLADKAIAGFTVNEAKIASLVEMNPILVTALNPVIGYEKGAAVAKQAFKEGRKVKDVAAEQTDLPMERINEILDPRKLTEGGVADA
ncbi:MAG: class II fumarate hydratase [Bryobacterales bacterium]|jgi:fumarate hydratase class II|nr:class II fumarate hydratase [Bryobacterales bacterium]